MAEVPVSGRYHKARSLGRGLFAGLIKVIRKHPNVMALIGFAFGTLSFILVQRQAETSRIIAGFMLLTWVWLILDKPIRQFMVTRLRFKLSPVALKFATQLVHQESLFFALPFFVITTSWGSPQMMFTLLLIMASAVSIVDPIYYKRIVANRWLLPLYHGFALFALLLTALPIVVSMTTDQSYLVALIIAGLVSVPMVTRTITGQQWWIWPGRALVLLSMGIAGYQLESWVPPATLWATDIAITQELDEERRLHGESLFNISATDLHADGLYAFTAIRAPMGLREVIYHEWRQDGELIDRIALPITGGREAGYRSWSHKMNFPADATGRWDLKVVTGGNQMIGHRTFVVGP